MTLVSLSSTTGSCEVPVGLDTVITTELSVRLIYLNLGADPAIEYEIWKCVDLRAQS